MLNPQVYRNSTLVGIQVTNSPFLTRFMTRLYVILWNSVGSAADGSCGDLSFWRRALCQPIVFKEYAMTEDAWHWLRNNQPESYEQLIGKLERAASRYLSSGGRTELRQLVRVFEWCEEHRIELADLEVPDHLHKYREAVVRLSRICDGDEPDQSKVQTMQETVGRIKSDPSRRATRAWARDWRGEKARGRQVVSGGEPVGLVVFGPSATIQRTRTEIERFVDWDLSIDDALLSDLRRAGQANE